MPKPKTSSKTTGVKSSTALFDIRLKNLDHDVLVIKGSEHEASSVLLNGNIVLSILEPMQVKKLSLRLYSTLRLSWTEKYQSTRGVVPRQMKYDKTIYEYNWDNFDLSSQTREFNAHNATALKSNNSSSSSLKGLGGLKSKSSSNLSSLSLSSFNHSSSSSNLKTTTTLAEGNYLFPFSAILPGTIPESVEGLPGGSVVYKLHATIERGRFNNNLTAKKHLRVIRTLTPDAVELSETMAVDNTWPKKVEYSISIPSRAVAIGSGTPISLLLVPMAKGLRLGKVKVSLTEYYSYCGSFGPTHSEERTICELKIPKPEEDDENFQMDKWEVEAFLQFPPSLSKCSQDVDIATNMKIRHKLKFVIGLINPDGHVSELRASLPIVLFISPFVAISARHEDGEDEGEVAHHENEAEDVLFSIDDQNLSSTSLNNINSSGIERVASPIDVMAPPVYENHIYDRLWSDISPVDSPTNSGATTPNPTSLGSHSQHSNIEISNHFNMSPLESSYTQLTENLRLLHLQRQSQEEGGMSMSPPSTRGARFNIGGGDDDYFSQSPQSATINTGIMSPGIMSPPIQYLSRTNSTADLSTSNTSIDSLSKEWDNNVISKVPSYTTAMKSEPNEDLTPLYEPPLPGSNINLAELVKKAESGVEFPKAKLKPSSRGSSANVSSLAYELSRSRGSSGNSSPTNSRNVSSSNLASLNLASLNSHLNTAAISISKSPQRGATALGGGMTPLSQSPQAPAVPAQAHTHIHRVPTTGSGSTSLTNSNSNSTTNLKGHTRSTSNVRPPMSARTLSSSSSNSKSNLSLSNLSFLHRKKSEKK